MHVTKNKLFNCSLFELLLLPLPPLLLPLLEDNETLGVTILWRLELIDIEGYVSRIDCAWVALRPFIWVDDMLSRTDCEVNFNAEVEICEICPCVRVAKSACVMPPIKTIVKKFNSEFKLRRE